MTPSQPYRYVRQVVATAIDGLAYWGWKYSEDKVGTCKRFEDIYIHSYERTAGHGFYWYAKTRTDARRVLARWRGQRSTEKRRLDREHALLIAHGTIVENLAPRAFESGTSHLGPSETVLSDVKIGKE